MEVLRVLSDSQDGGRGTLVVVVLGDGVKLENSKHFEVTLSLGDYTSM